MQFDLYLYQIDNLTSFTTGNIVRKMFQANSFFKEEYSAYALVQNGWIYGFTGGLQCIAYKVNIGDCVIPIEFLKENREILKGKPNFEISENSIYLNGKEFCFDVDKNTVEILKNTLAEIKEQTSDIQEVETLKGQKVFITQKSLKFDHNFSGANSDLAPALCYKTWSNECAYVTNAHQMDYDFDQAVKEEFTFGVHTYLHKYMNTQEEYKIHLAYKVNTGHYQKVVITSRTSKIITNNYLCGRNPIKVKQLIPTHECEGVVTFKNNKGTESGKLTVLIGFCETQKEFCLVKFENGKVNATRLKDKKNLITYPFEASKFTDNLPYVYLNAQLLKNVIESLDSETVEIKVYSPSTGVVINDCHLLMPVYTV